MEYCGIVGCTESVKSVLFRFLSEDQDHREVTGSVLTDNKNPISRLYGGGEENHSALSHGRALCVLCVP